MNDAIKNLQTNQQQLDADGCMVGVSRQALDETLAEVERLQLIAGAPIPIFLTCPACGARHIDEGEFATKAHHTHACQACGLTWRPALVPTVGVQFLPGFKN